MRNLSGRHGAVIALLVLSLVWGSNWIIMKSVLAYIGPITFSLYWMLLGLTSVTAGLQCIYMGILAQIFFDYSGETTKSWFSVFSYTRTVFISAAVFILGVALTGALLAHYVSHQFLLAPEARVNHFGVTGLLLMIAGFMTFTFTLLLHSTAVAVWRRP